jgi:hypothetical protein
MVIGCDDTILVNKEAAGSSNRLPVFVIDEYSRNRFFLVEDNVRYRRVEDGRNGCEQKQKAAKAG